MRTRAIYPALRETLRALRRALPPQNAEEAAQRALGGL
jgi:hypothetical protein